MTMQAGISPQTRAGEGDDIRAMLRQSVTGFAAQNPGVARSRRLRDTRPGHDAETWQAMADAGWLGVALPEAYGGTGLGLAEQCVIAEELGADLAPEPFGAASLAAMVLAGGDNVALREKLLCAYVQGKLMPAFAWQEAPNRIDPLAMATILSRENGALVLSGQKRFVQAAGSADGFVVTALNEDGPCVCWVPSTLPGVRVDSVAGVDVDEVYSLTFDHVRLDAGAIVARAPTASRLLPRVFDEALLLASAELLGLTRAAIARTLAYVRQRSQFGKPIGSFQALQHRLVDLWIQQELALACLERGLDTLAATDDPRRRAAAASAVKARASATAMLVGRQSIQFHGAIGYADEHDIGFYLKRAIVCSSWLGTAAVHRRRFAAMTTAEPAMKEGRR